MTGRRFSAEWLDEITGVSDQWLRRCNKHPKDGILINRHGLRIILAQSADVSVRENDVIAWRAQAGEFTAEPVRTQIPSLRILAETTPEER